MGVTIRRQWVQMLVILVIVLTSCDGQRVSTYVASYNGREYTIDIENHIISDGKYMYPYERNTSSIQIEYPNGDSYHYEEYSGGSTGGWATSSLYEDSTLNKDYASEDDLVYILQNTKQASQGAHEAIFLGMIFLIIGGFNTFLPELSWQLSHGWKYKNAEPTDFSLGLIRFGGIVTMIIAIGFMVF